MDPSKLPILIVLIAGIGDIIMASPAFRAIRNGHPEAKICLLTSTDALPIARHYPVLDEVILFPIRELRNHMRRRMRDALRRETLLSLVGNYVPLKGHPHLLRAFAEARKGQGRSVKLLCTGRILNADYHRSLLTLLGELGIEADVTLLDYTPDITDLLCATDIFALPSQREGFSRSLLEAMAMGLPVIASRIDEFAEAVEDQRGGILAG